MSIEAAQASTHHSQAGGEMVYAARQGQTFALRVATIQACAFVLNDTA